MITVSTIYPSGTLEVSALVKDTVTREVWYERRAFYGYGKAESRKLFRAHLVDSRYVLVND